MKNTAIKFISIHFFLLVGLATTAQVVPTKFEEDDFYNISTVPLPEGVVLEVGGLATFPDGRLAISTRRGEVFIIANAEMKNDSRSNVTKFATGMNEVLGLAYKDGHLYCMQRSELTKLIDSDNDGKADIYETVATWPLSGNYHEYGFGPKVDQDGNFIVSLNLGFGSPKWYEATSNAPFRGWLLKITPDGKIEPWSVGHRSPCGLFVHPETGEYFYTENQGDWVGSGGITHCAKGDFVGNPAGLAWANEPNSPIKFTHEEFCKIMQMCTNDAAMGLDREVNSVPDLGKPMFESTGKIPNLKTQAITLPHSIMGQSTSDMIYIPQGNNFAPYFAGQILVGDQFASKIVRVNFEKVKGVYQGVAFDFRKDFVSGILRFAWGNEGSLFVGMTNRGWGSIGKLPWGLQKVMWTKKTPFEMKDVKAKPDGFEIEFLLPVDKKTAANIKNYAITSFTYKYHSRYGSPIIKDTACPVRAAVVSEDGMKVRLVVDLLREGYVHEIKVNNVVSAANVSLLHNAAYYTLKVIPDGEKLKVAAITSGTNAGREIPLANKTKGLPPEMGNAKSIEMAKAVAQSAKPKSAAPMGKSTGKQPAWWATVDKTINLGTRPGLMYDQQKITIKGGQKVKLIFINNDDMQHNVVIVKPGKADAVGEIATNMGLEGPKLYYVPKSDDVLFHTKLVSPGTSENIYFEAPKTPGNYQIVCTYPGHYATMQAILVVTP